MILSVLQGYDIAGFRPSILYCNTYRSKLQLWADDAKTL